MYKKEDLKFFNMKTREDISSKRKIYEIEDTLNREEKIKFIDELENGIATYLLNIISKWETEKESLPKDNYGDVKTVSKKAWIKRNDSLKKINNEYDIGHYFLFGEKYMELSLICPHAEYNRMLYTGKDIVHQWFHDLCDELYFKEKKYFKSIDSVSIKLKQIEEYVSRYNIVFNKTVNDIAWNSKEDVSEKELDIYLDVYKKIDEYVNKITEEVKEKIEEL